MKKILILLVISISLLQSCKKDAITSTTNDKLETSKFNPNNIEDMNAYLSDFIKNMKSTSKESTSMSLEDAQWHLTACLNYQFCNVNVKKTEIVYDTIYTDITIENDLVCIENFSNVFYEISTLVNDIFDSYNFENKNILFINPLIKENMTRSGGIVETIIATSNYYFDDDFNFDTIFPPDSTYLWNTEAIECLEYYMNIFEPEQDTNSTNREYYTIIYTHICDYRDYDNNMLFNTQISDSYRLNAEEMAACLDSYLSLINFHRPIPYCYISSEIKANNGNNNNNNSDEILEPVTYNHELRLFYGMLAAHVTPGNGNATR